jgi:alcohol dehydrogenase class IV
LAGLPRTLKETGVHRKALEEIAHKAIKDPALAFNPLPVTHADALKLLEKAY